MFVFLFLIPGPAFAARGRVWEGLGGLDGNPSAVGHPRGENEHGYTGWGEARACGVQGGEVEPCVARTLGLPGLVAHFVQWTATCSR